MPSGDSFQIRVRNAVKGTYQTSMRRSLQSVALYEADRCLKHRYPQLRPFQKKYALFATAVDLLSTLDFLNDYHRQEIMFRTNASKEPLAPDLAWRRMKLITREIKQTIIPKAEELIANGDNKDKSHEEFCELLLQKMYEENNESDKPHPPMWEFNHNNVFSVYRIFYCGVDIDPNLFPPKPPRMVGVPLRKPDTFRLVPNIVDASSIPLASMAIGSGRGGDVSEEERRAMLKEVKDHTELLKEFEGVIPEEELIKRKRALYAALPPVPPPSVAAGVVGGGKKEKKKAKTAAVSVPSIPKLMAVTPKPVIPTAGVLTKPTAMEEEEEEDLEEVGAGYQGRKEPANVITAV